MNTCIKCEKWKVFLIDGFFYHRELLDAITKLVVLRKVSTDYCHVIVLESDTILGQIFSTDDFSEFGRFSPVLNELKKPTQQDV